MWQRFTLMAGILLFAAPALAGVVVFDQLTSIDTEATSSCPSEVDPEPDQDSVWIDVVDDVDASTSSQMSSACGVAEFGGSLQLTFAAHSVEGVFTASSSLDSLGNGTAATNGLVLIRATTPTTWTFTATGTVLDNGSSDAGTVQLAFAEEADIWTDGFTVSWGGSLIEGETVVLSLTAITSRIGEWIDGIPILMNGDTLRTVSFRLEFEDEVTPTLPVSLGQLKAKF